MTEIISLASLKQQSGPRESFSGTLAVLALEDALLMSLKKKDKNSKSCKKRVPSNPHQPFGPVGVLVFPSVSNHNVMCPSQEPRWFGGS